MDINKYKYKSGYFIPVWTLEIQTSVADVDKIESIASNQTITSVI